MASRSQSQARSQAAPEVNKNGNKVSDVSSGCGKPSPAPNNGGAPNGSGYGASKRRDKNRRWGATQPSQQGGGGNYNNSGNRHKQHFPQNRSGNSGSKTPQVNRNSSVTEADEIEIGSVFKSGSKKQNLNHLLNFKKYEPRNAGSNNQRGHDRRPRGGGKHKQTPVVTYTREQYLAANCQFLVKASGDYSVQIVDPDIPVDWQFIEEVKLFTSGSDPLSCPICLFPPRPGKIGRCGHVFCWPCILHYLALSDDDYRKCPICYDNIHRQDLKSVRVIPQETYSTGSFIELRLMKRERNSLFAVPVSHAGLEQVPAVEDSFLDRSLSKLVKATPEQVLEIVLERERRELEAVYAEEKDTPESVFITEAIRLLEQKVESCALENIALAEHCALPKLIEQKIEEDAVKKPELDDTEESGHLGNTELKPLVNRMKQLDPFDDENKDDFTKATLATVSPTSSYDGGSTSPGSLTQDFLLSPESEDNSLLSPKVEDSSPKGGEDVGEGVKERHSSAGSSVGSEGGEIFNEDSTITAEDLDISNYQDVSQKSQANVKKEVFYFYQESNGQRVFLHALNVQMLVHEFGSLDKCPATLTAKILEMDSSTMTEHLRGRLRYLRHLPLSCSFDVAELDLNSIVSRSTYAMFKDQIADRRRRRQKKQTLEQRREKKIRLEEMRIMNRFPSPVARIESEEHYPRMDDFLPAPDVPDSSTNFQNQSSSSGPQEQAYPGLNFASIAKKASGGAKAKKTAAAPTQEQPTYLSVRGGTSAMVTLGAVPRTRRVTADSDSEPEVEGYTASAPRTSTLGASLAQALAQAGNKKQKGQGNTAGEGGKKKGRRSRGIPLQL